MKTDAILVEKGLILLACVVEWINILEPFVSFDVCFDEVAVLFVAHSFDVGYAECLDDDCPAGPSSGLESAG